ncbi:hypothetical protein GCM10020218_105620 [Dactylosporangium vinaceum]
MRRAAVNRPAKPGVTRSPAADRAPSMIDQKVSLSTATKSFIPMHTAATGKPKATPGSAAENAARERSGRAENGAGGLSGRDKNGGRGAATAAEGSRRQWHVSGIRLGAGDRNVLGARPTTPHPKGRAS